MQGRLHTSRLSNLPDPIHPKEPLDEYREKQYAFRVKKYEMQIEQEKARLVNGLIKDLKTWLSNAEQFSNDVLASFGNNK